MSEQASATATPLISIVVCTYNRAGLLAATLRSLQEQMFAAESYEVVVVDNGSSDNTREVVEGFAKGATVIRYEREPKLGLSNARNCGIKASRAAIVAFTDDDCEADAGWVEGIYAGFQRSAIRPLAVGGRVRPNWEAPPPKWLSPAWYDLLSLVDYGDEAHVCSGHEHLYGCNFAFERSFLLEAGGFDPALGRRGGSLISNEDSLMVDRVRASNGEIRYEPEAIVRHFIPSERVSLGWLTRRMYAQGASNVLSARQYAAQGGRSDRSEGSSYRAAPAKRNRLVSLANLGLRSRSPEELWNNAIAPALFFLLMRTSHLAGGGVQAAKEAAALRKRRGAV